MKNLSLYGLHETVDQLEESTQKHIYHNSLKNGVKKVLICIEHYSKINNNMACKVKADTIGEKTQLSRSSVMRAIKTLNDLEIIQKTNEPKLNGIKGSNVYRIVPFTYDLKMTHREMTQRDTSEEVNNDAVCEQKNETEYIKSFKELKDLKTSTINNIYINAYAHEKFLNEWQITLIELLNSFKVDKVFGEEFNKVIAATEITNAKEFHMVKDIIINMAMDLQSGRLNVDTTLRAIYKGAYKAKVERQVLEVKEEVKAVTERTVPFYNWLDEREVVL